MKFTIENFRSNPTTLLRRAGYTFQHKTENNEMSFIRPMGRSGYPRFHMYVRVNGTNMEIIFHLDQKKHTYGDETRHHGEYEESGALEEEANRLKMVLR